jgi:hypothetical protein
MEIFKCSFFVYIKNVLLLKISCKSVAAQQMRSPQFKNEKMFNLSIVHYTGITNKDSVEILIQQQIVYCINNIAK